MQYNKNSFFFFTKYSKAQGSNCCDLRRTEILSRLNSKATEEVCYDRYNTTDGRQYGFFFRSEHSYSNIPDQVNIQKSSIKKYCKIQVFCAHNRHRTSVMREFSASRHFFKTNMTQSVAELILYIKKKQTLSTQQQFKPRLF